MAGLDSAARGCQPPKCPASEKLEVLTERQGRAFPEKCLVPPTAALSAALGEVRANMVAVAQW